MTSLCSSVSSVIRNRFMYTNPLYIFTTIGISALFFLAVWNTQEKLIGTQPTQEFSPEVGGEGHAGKGHADQQFNYKDPDIERLKEATKLRPDDKTTWVNLVKTILDKIHKGIVSRDQGSLEAISALQEILRIDKDDPQALMLMADVSFDQQVFPKAKEYYERYLAINSTDDAARTRYASTLTFMGEASRAVEILKEVSSRAPENFKINAFLALAYGQLGDKENVKLQGEKALSLAPDEESKKRLTAFLKRFEGPKVTNARGTNSDGSLETYFRNHQIVGPKLVKVTEEAGVMMVYLDNFPMSAMPPFAKEKFENGIRSFAAENKITDISQLIFLDSKTIGTSIAADIAHQHNVPNATRDVFLDHEETPEFLQKALKNTERVARNHGAAIAIGSITQNLPVRLFENFFCKLYPSKFCVP